MAQAMTFITSGTTTYNQASVTIDTSSLTDYTELFLHIHGAKSTRSVVEDVLGFGINGGTGTISGTTAYANFSTYTANTTQSTWIAGNNTGDTVDGGLVQLTITNPFDTSKPTMLGMIYASGTFQVNTSNGWTEGDSGSNQRVDSIFFEPIGTFNSNTQWYLYGTIGA